VLIERGGLIPQVVGADDGGVAADIAAAEMALFQHRHIGDAVLLRQIVSGSQTVTAAADDNHVIAFLRYRVAPDLLPVLMKAQTVSEQAKS